MAKDLDIDDAIAKAEAKVHRLRLELAAENARLKVMAEARRLMRGEKVPSKPKQTIADLVEDILRMSGKPMHIDDIVKAIHQRTSGNNKVAKETVTTAVWRYAKQGRRFRNTAPNTFELLK